jgi:hypothetical protein
MSDCTSRVDHLGMTIEHGPAEFDCRSIGLRHVLCYLQGFFYCVLFLFHGIKMCQFIMLI